MFLLLSGSAWGQTTVGVTASGFLNKVSLVNFTEPGNPTYSFEGIDNRPGFSVGGFSQTNYTSWLSTRAEINYTNAGFVNRNSDNILFRRNTINYLQVSQMIGVRTKTGFSLSTGPMLNIHVGSSSRSRQITKNAQGKSVPSGRWIASQALLSTPASMSAPLSAEGTTKSFVLGWQIQAACSYKRLSVQVRRQWLFEPVGSLSFPYSFLKSSRSDFFFSSWQYGLSYTLFEPKAGRHQYEQP